MTEQSGRGERHLSRKDFLKYSLASGVVWAGSQGVENFVVVTGDIHSYIAGYVRENYDDPTPPVLETEAEPEPNPLNRLAGTCFVCGSVTSSNLVELS